MGERVIYHLDLLDPGRRRLYNSAARRNGLKLSAWLREVADAAAERAPLPAASEVLVPVADPEPEMAEVHVHVPRSLPWGGRQCEGCGELL